MSPAPVYDDEKAKAQGHHDDLGVHPERAEAEAQDLEDAFNMGEADDPQDGANNLARREAEGYGPGESSLPTWGGGGGTLPQRKEKDALDDKTGGLYRDEGKAGNTADSVGGLYDNSDDNKKGGKLGTILFGAGGSLKEKANNLSSKKKALLFGVGLGGSGLFVAIVILVTLFATLKIPNLSEHIATWQFARNARTFRQSLSQVNAEKIAVDSADDSKFGAMKSKYEGFRSTTWGKLDQWRPTLTYKNMQSTGFIDYQYGEANLLGRKKLEAVRLNGKAIPIDNPTLGRKLANRVNPLTPKADIILAAQIDANLAKGMHDHKTLVRSSVNKKILNGVNVKLHWWDKLGSTYRGAKAAEADLLELNNSLKRISADSPDSSLVKPIQDTVDQSKAAQKRCLENPDCAKQFLEADPPDAPPGTITDAQRARLNGDYPTNFLSEETRASLLTNIEDPKLKAAEIGSTTVAVALSVCIIYDGSIERSAGTVDASSTSAIRSFYAVTSAADQQKAGDTSAEAVGATNRKLGDISSSVPEKRARNNNLPLPTDDAIQSPQASAAGTFSLFGALFGSEFAKSIDPIVEPTCKAATDWRVGLGIGVGELALAVLTGGTSKGGTVVAGAGVRATATKIVTKVSETLLTKKALKRMLTETVAIAGLTVLAKMIVLARMNAQNSGVARGQNFADIADAGGNLAAGEVDRKMLMGRTMTQPEIAYSQEADRQYIAEKKGEKGIYDRYFALSNPDSLLVNMGVGLSTKLSNKQGLTKLVSNSAANFGNSMIGSTSIASALNPFKKQVVLAQAATSGDTNYNLVQWGWTEDELNLIENNPTYFPLENDVILEQSGKKDLIQQKYGDCFSKTMGELLKDGKIQRDEEGRVYEDAGDCAPKKLGRNNPDGFGDMVFRWRISGRNNNTLDHLTGIQNPKESVTASSNTGGETGLLAPGALAWPVRANGSNITSCYGPRTHPITGATSMHPGVDISIAADTPAFAVADGEVTFAAPADGYGANFVIIKHGPGLYSSYGHMNSHTVNKGDTVTQGQQIGTVGSQGYSTGPHMHFNLISGTDNFAATFNGNTDPLKNGMSIPEGAANSARCAAS